MPLPPTPNRAAALARAASKAAGDPPAIPAATVVPLRRGEAGIEVLMVRRNSKLEFAGGMWVFPGGRLDEDDHTGASDLEEAARRAAAREAAEEAGLALDASSLVWFAHWTPPQVSIKRFATFFFVAHAQVADEDVTIDGGEIHDHVWCAPVEAMRRRDAAEIELSPPTWITLAQLTRAAAGARDVTVVLDRLAGAGPEFFETRIAMTGDAAVALYEGDAGYADTDPERPGGRHRLWMGADGWRYERDDWD